MSIVDKLEGWFASAAIEIPTYECAQCGEALEGPIDPCPECGGEVTEDASEWVPVYWDGLD